MTRNRRRNVSRNPTINTPPNGRTIAVVGDVYRFLATGEEYMSTRGRANAIRAALELRVAQLDILWAALDAEIDFRKQKQAAYAEAQNSVEYQITGKLPAWK